jgi:GntR family transcriptional regulator
MLPRRIDQKSFIPRYYQLFDILREQIEAGEWAIGEAIPPERVLAVYYRVSLETVKHAAHLLSEAGYISRQRGRGTFVRAYRPRAKAGKEGA